MTNISEQQEEEMVEVKLEAGTSFEFEGNERIIIGQLSASENLGKEENLEESAAGSEDGEEAGGGGGVVKLQPRVSRDARFVVESNNCRTRKHYKQSL